MPEEEIDIFQSYFVPKHEILKEENKMKLLKSFNIHLKQLPRIKKDDPAIQSLNAKRGDVIKITRDSPLSGEYSYYRVVV